MSPISREWLNAAKDDLALIEHILPDVQLTHLVAFHAQQAIEKALKARLDSQGKSVPKTHSLNRLFELNSMSFVGDDADLVNILDELYIEARYPVELGLLPNGKPSLGGCRT
jgi:HEPN domain-containing protein